MKDILLKFELLTRVVLLLLNSASPVNRIESQEFQTPKVKGFSFR